MIALEQVLGSLAVVFYSLVLMPQIVKGLRNHSMEGMSFVTVFLWSIADLINLISALLLDQIYSVKATATLFVSIDVTTIILYLYYEKWKRPNERLYQIKISIYRLFGILVIPNAVSAISQHNFRVNMNIIDGNNDLFVNQEMLGSALAWGCALLYFGSRLPQIMLFYTRHRTLDYQPIYEDEGEIVVDEENGQIAFNYWVWIFMICANCLYTSSLLITESQKSWNPEDFISRTLPYILGSGGTIPMDLLILHLGWR